MTGEEEKREIRELVDGLGLQKDVSAEDFKNAVKSAIKDRAILFYCVWKKLQELYPDVDADLFMQKVAWDFGVIKGNQLAQKIGGTEGKTPKDILRGQITKAAMLVFDQEVQELNDRRAVKYFRACPHVEAFRELGANPDEIKKLCRNMLCYDDYGNYSMFPGVKIEEFPTTIADNEGKGCAMTFVSTRD